MANRPEGISNKQAQRMGWLYATAINFAATVGIFTLAGYGLDRWLKIAPWGIIGGLVLGLVGGTLKFIRDGLALNREVSRETAGHGHKWREFPEQESPEGGEPER